MKFSIGDKILFKRSGDSGTITSILNDEMVEVDLDGTVFPVFVDEIDHPFLKWFTEKAQKKKPDAAMPEIRPEKPLERKRRLATGIYLSFLPVFKTEEMEDRVDYLKVYLLNELPHDLQYEYECRVKQIPVFAHTGALHSFGSVYLHNVSDDQMNDQARFDWKAYQTQAGKIENAEGILKIKPIKYFEHINEILAGKDSSFSYLLADILKPEQEKLKYDMDLPEAPRMTASKTNNVKSGQSEPCVDLHIENLVGNTRGLSNTDIITIQLGVLQRTIEKAVAHRQELLVVVHGLGKGTLREEVHKILKRTKEVARFKNEWSAKYGFGATEVWFNYF